MNTFSGAGAIIKNSDDHVFLIKIKRRGMIRWELPTGIRKEKESIFVTLFRSVEEDSSFQFVVRIGRPVCFALHYSIKKDLQYFGMFFECKVENNSIRPAYQINDTLPKELCQEVLDTSFIDWRKLASIDIHPQHHEILIKWSQIEDESLFAVVGDADSELTFFKNAGSVDSFILDKFVTTKCNQNKISHKLFISYSKDDIVHKDTLLKHLSGLRDRIVTWHDRDLLPGEEWDERIKQELQQADIVLYLVSANSMATNYIQNIELPLIEQRCKDKECILIPVVLDFCHWHKLEFAKYNALPEKGIPITNNKVWTNENEAWLKVVEGVEHLVNNIKST